MWEAIRKAASLVEPENGTFVIAIYNHHWTSPIWKQIKRLYNLSPDPLRRMLNCFFAIAIYVGVWVTARQNPLHKERGMDFWYDVIDWLGGYPYEYGRITDVVKFVEPLGFQADRITKPRGWTGCNEFVFRRSKPSHESN
jgi:2-polyprenyl-6-hydroxyphenyl methylase/3-demethylubiquinone-9 3-methyltransferase